MRSKKELNDIAKGNYAILEGFRQGFCQNWKNALNSRYYEQLRDEVFGFKRITPRQFIEHLEQRWVKLDTMVIKRLRAKFFRGWDELEHVTSFRIRLDREQKRYKEYVPPVTISDAKKKQHYLEEVLREPEKWGEKCVTAWDKETTAQKAWPAPISVPKRGRRRCSPMRR